MDDGRAAIDTAVTLGTGTAFAMAMVLLAARGAFTLDDVEAIRHTALRGFDEVAARTKLLPKAKAERERVEAARGHLETMWDRVVAAAEQARAQPRR